MSPLNAYILSNFGYRMSFKPEENQSPLGRKKRQRGDGGPRHISRVIAESDELKKLLKDCKDGAER
ncbi:MAG: hypothetical protein Kapaf2KO_23760 [Candidatus Kapaibacteriales bacterium]